MDPISKPILSEKWQQKFQILKKIGADQGFKNLDYKIINKTERSQVMFNWLAFIFGPFYYFAKGMEHKGCFFLGLAFLIGIPFDLVEYFFNLQLPIIVSAMPVAIICSQMANTDYYRKINHHEKMWPSLSFFNELPFVIGFTIISIALSFWVIQILYSPELQPLQ